MDRVDLDKINNFNLNQVRKTSVIILKKKKNEFKTILYVVVSATEQEIEDTKRVKALTEGTLMVLKDNNLITLREEVKTVVFLGELKNYYPNDEIVYKFPKRKVDIRENKPDYYRDYSKTVEEQKDSMWLVNTAPSLAHCWASVTRKCNSKYGLILEIVINNENNTRNN